MNFDSAELVCIFAKSNGLAGSFRNRNLPFVNRDSKAYSEHTQAPA